MLAALLLPDQIRWKWKIWNVANELGRFWDWWQSVQVSYVVEGDRCELLSIIPLKKKQSISHLLVKA